MGISVIDTLTRGIGMVGLNGPLIACSFSFIFYAYFVTGFRRYNIMDNMVTMLEKYATNLEYVVNDKDKLLTNERKKMDLLLHQMLPV